VYTATGIQNQGTEANDNKKGLEEERQTVTETVRQNRQTEKETVTDK
jgi:hypothetical protein